MTRKLARFLVATLLLAFAECAAASSTEIDIFANRGVPGTGGWTTLPGPCYCDQSVYFSPVFLLAPGTYDFGKVRDYWAQSGGTPDGGPDQPNFYLLFTPFETAGAYPGDFSSEPDYLYPSGTMFCDQHDDACNASFSSAYQDVDLTLTVGSGQNAVQIGLVGRFQYTSPVPEPLPCAMLMLGLSGIALSARRSAHLTGVRSRGLSALGEAGVSDRWC